MPRPITWQLTQDRPALPRTPRIRLNLLGLLTANNNNQMREMRVSWPKKRKVSIMTSTMAKMKKKAKIMAMRKRSKTARTH